MLNLNKYLFFIVAVFFASHVVAAPKIEEWYSSNGARVLFVQADSLPMVDFSISFAAGAARDGELYGLAVATNSLLNEGAGGVSATEISKRLEQVGIKLGAGVSKDMAWIGMRSLSNKEKLQHGIEVLNMMLTNPDFGEQQIERQKNFMRINLEQIKQSPDKIAGLTMFAKLYPDHPYGRPTDGNKDTIEQIKRSDVQGFFKRYYVAENATVVIVGDIDSAGAHELVEQVLAGVAKGEKAEVLPQVETVNADDVEIEYPSQQTHILIGQNAIKKGDPRFHALYVGNYILGGGSLISLLGDEIRVKRGLAYSIYSYFSTMRQRGIFILGAQTRGEQAQQSVEVMRQVLRDFIENGPTQEQLDAAKKSITGSYPLGVASNSDIAGFLKVIGFYDLPLDYMDTFTAKIDKVTVKDVQEAFAAVVKPENMVTVLVGRKIVDEGVKNQQDEDE